MQALIIGLNTRYDTEDRIEKGTVMLRIAHITTGYGTGQALADISFSIEKCDSVSNNGSGKSVVECSSFEEVI